MISYEDAIAWVESQETTDEDRKRRVLNRMRYERDQNIPVKPKYHKGKSISDWYTCGNCGHGIREVTDNFCSNCGYEIKWDNPRCLTK